MVLLVWDEHAPVVATNHLDAQREMKVGKLLNDRLATTEWHPSLDAPKGIVELHKLGANRF